MKKYFSIAQKIWFSFSILIIGYLFSMVLGFYLGQQIESRLLRVSVQMFPLAQKSEVALAKYREMMRLYYKGTMIGDPKVFGKARNVAGEVFQTLHEMAIYKPEQDKIHSDILETATSLKNFSARAEKVYIQLSENNENSEVIKSITEESKILANWSKTIEQKLEGYSIRFSQELNNEIASVRHTSRHQRFTNLFLFIGVVIFAIILIALIISRCVVKPLKKTFMLEAVTEQFNDGIAVTDLSGRIIFANRAWGEMHGFVQEELIGEIMNRFHTPEQMNNEFLPIYQTAYKEGLCVGEIWHQHKNGQKTPTFTSISQITDEQGKRIGHVHSVKDITTQKKYEKELKKAKKEADTANAAKSIFLANMSHEIRTPLNGVMGVLNLLLSTELNKEQLDLVQTGKTSADNLLTVISDILDFSKIEAGKLDMEILDFDLRNTIEEIVKLPAMQAHNKGLEFAYSIHSDVPSLIQGDPVRVRQIILNLTNNAIKFTQNGEIVMRVNLINESDRDVKIKFEVTDTGIGIPEEKLDHIFKEFQQTDSSTTRMYGGTGLGLSISKKLAEMMNGEIGVTSIFGKGSAFWFTALFSKQPRSEKPLVVLPDSVANKRLLIVDDNKTNLEILGGYLSTWGCSYDMAQSGEMALTLMAAVGKVDAPFDAVIIDMQMPGMDGAELGQRIKNDPGLRDTKLVMLTSMGLRGDATRMKEIGFSIYLTKPIRRSQLFNSLVTLFSQELHVEDQKQQALITRHTLSEQEKQNINILVAEDNVINQKLVLRIIENFGFRAEAVTTGKEVIERLRVFDYNLVLMDVHMPDMDGIEATRKIRDRQTRVYNNELPIIALTANAMKGDKEICFNAGMNDYVAKPINPQELLEAIERNIKNSRKSDFADAL